MPSFAGETRRRVAPSNVQGLWAGLQDDLDEVELPSQVRVNRHSAIRKSQMDSNWLRSAVRTSTPPFAAASKLNRASTKPHQISVGSGRGLGPWVGVVVWDREFLFVRSWNYLP